MLKKDSSNDIKLNLETCLLANTSICEVTNSDRYIVAVYNPLERNVTHFVRLPVLDGSYKITGPDGEVKFDLVDSISTFDYVDKTFGTPKGKELVFPVTNIPGFAVRLYYIERTASKPVSVKKTSQVKFGTDVCCICSKILQNSKVFF